MKNLKKLLVGFLCVFAMVAIIKVPANAAINNYFYETGCTTSSVTVGWNWNVYFSGESLKGIYIRTADNKYRTETYNKYATSLTLTGLPANYKGTLYLGYIETDGSRTYFTNGISINVQPQAMDWNNGYINGRSTSGVNFSANLPSGVTGAYFYLYKNYAPVGTFAATPNTGYVSVAKDCAYQYRAVYYTYNPSNGQTYFGAAGPIRQFVYPTVSGGSKSNKKGFSMKLKKATGVSKYVIQVSPYSSTYGFKNAKTVKLSKKKTYKFQVTKKYGKRRTNYIRVCPYIKGYGYSDLTWAGSVYVFK